MIFVELSGLFPGRKGEYGDHNERSKDIYKFCYIHYCYAVFLCYRYISEDKTNDKRHYYALSVLLHVIAF